MNIYEDINNNIHIILGTFILSNILYYIVLKIELIKKIRIKFIRFKNKFYKTIVIDKSGMDLFHNYVINYDDKNIYEHICKLTNDNRIEYINFINTNLPQYKKYIIESLMKQSMTQLNNYKIHKMNYQNFYYWVMHSITFAYRLDYTHTINIFNENIKDDINNVLILNLNLSLGGFFTKPYSDQINDLKKKINELETHIKYMPGGDGYHEAKQNFEKLAS